MNMVNDYAHPPHDFSEVDLLNVTANELDSAADFFDPVADYHLPFHKDPVLTPQPSYDEIRLLRLRCSKLERCVDSLNQTVQSLEDEYEDQSTQH